MNQRTIALTFITLLLAVAFISVGFTAVWMNSKQDLNSTPSATVTVTQEATPTPEVFEDGIEDTADEGVTVADMGECSGVCEVSCDGFETEEEKITCLEDCSLLCENY